MKLKRDTKLGEELTCRFKIDIKNLTNFDLSTQKSQIFSLSWTPFERIIYCLSLKGTVELSFMTLKSDAQFEEKLICCLKNDMRKLANFHQSTRSVKIKTLTGFFCPK